MASVLDQIQGQQQRETDQGLAQAWHDNQWAQQFTSTPPAEKLRANLNLTDMVDKAVQLKQDLLAQTDLKAMALKAKTAEFDEWQKQAPLREQLLRARVDATGATERRKAEEAALEATDTAKLNRGIAALYSKGLRRGTQEFIDGAAQIMADAPHANGNHVMEIGKAVGLLGDTPEEKLANAITLVKEREKAKAALQPTLEAKLANDVAREKALGEVRQGFKPDPEIKSLETARALHQSALDRASTRRISAQKAFDKAKEAATDSSGKITNQELINNNLDLVRSADEEISAAKAALGDVDAQIKARRGAPAAAPAAPAANQAALDWLSANPNDPRAPAVRAKLGL
jgi:hypothetical protein